jgi:hypothetical protein
MNTNHVSGVNFDKFYKFGHRKINTEIFQTKKLEDISALEKDAGNS